MSSTTTRGLIGSEDISWQDGVNETFTRANSTGGDTTLTKVGTEVDLYSAWDSDLVRAVDKIGSGYQAIRLRTGSYALTRDLTVPANISLRFDPGAIITVATGKTLTINGIIEAGPYQIFAWGGTGAFALSGSPTSDIYIQWFGGISGGSENISTALVKLAASIGTHQRWRMTKGTWRIATATTIDNEFGFGIKGDSVDSCLLQIDTGGAVGLTFGSVGNDNYNLDLSDFSVVGKASCCTYGIKVIREHNTTINNVNLCLGATQYGIAFYGCLFLKTRNLMGSRSYTGFGAASYVPPANFVYIANDSTSPAMGMNVVDLHVINTGGITGYGVYANGLTGTDVSTVFFLSGDIENCQTQYPVYITDYHVVDIKDLYVIDSNAAGPYIKNVRMLRLSNVDANNALDAVTTIDNVWGAEIKHCRFERLWIKATCRGIVLDDIEIADNNGLTDDAPDTRIGMVRIRDSAYGKSHYPGKAADRRNLMSNPFFARWASDKPDGWDTNANSLWVQCGTALADTTNRKTPYCAQLEAHAATADTKYTCTASEIKQLQGKIVNFSIWQKIKAAQTFAANQYPLVYLNVDVPTWTQSTAYEIGEAIIPTAPDGFMYVCIVAGTSGLNAAEPTWPGVLDQTVAEGSGTCVWHCQSKSVNSGQYMPSTSADIGVWKRVYVSTYVPKNATAIYPDIIAYRQTPAADAYYYFSEACLMTGPETSEVPLPGQNEFQDFIQLGAIRIYFGTAAPAVAGVWYNQGDLCFRSDATSGQATGWSCVVGGVAGAASWKAMGNLA